MGGRPGRVARRRGFQRGRGLRVGHVGNPLRSNGFVLGSIAEGMTLYVMHGILQIAPGENP